jgi:hypothetical protein
MATPFFAPITAETKKTFAKYSTAVPGIKSFFKFSGKFPERVRDASPQSADDTLSPLPSRERHRVSIDEKDDSGDELSSSRRNRSDRWETSHRSARGLRLIRNSHRAGRASTPPLMLEFGPA